MRTALHLLVEVAPDQHAGQQAQRDIDEEDPAPEVQLGEEPAEGRTDHRGDAPDAGDVALHPSPLGDAVDVAGDGDRHRLHRAGAEPLQGPERDEDRHAPGEAAEHRAEQEHPDAEEHQRLPADGVRELGVDRDRHGLGEQVDREQPRERREPAQLAHDRRHGRRQDRRVDGDEAGGDHQGQQHRPAFRPQSDSGRDSGCRGGRHLVGKSSRLTTIPGTGGFSR